MEKVIGKNENKVHFISLDEKSEWSSMSKIDVAKKLSTKIANHFA